MWPSEALSPQTATLNHLKSHSLNTLERPPHGHDHNVQTPPHSTPRTPYTDPNFLSHSNPAPYCMPHTTPQPHPPLHVLQVRGLKPPPLLGPIQSWVTPYHLHSTLYIPLKEYPKHCIPYLQICHSLQTRFSQSGNHWYLRPEKPLLGGGGGCLEDQRM